MSTSPIGAYIGRSLGLLRRNTAKVMKMEVDPQTPPLSIFSFNSSNPPVTPLTSLAIGSDADIGGLSTCTLSHIASSASDSSQSHLAFHGNMSLKVPPAYANRIRTGYAAFRTKTRPTLFGEETWDLGLYSHLRVVVGYRGWEGWRGRWVVNLQTDGPVRSDLFQHRLPLPRSPSSTSSRMPLDPHSPNPSIQFTTLHLPLSQFVLTNSGHTSATQIPMLRSRVRTVGFGLLGGGRGEEELPSSSSLSTSGIEGEETWANERMISGGWGRPSSDEELDAELEDLIRSDSREKGVSRPGSGSIDAKDTPRPAGLGRYHTVGSTSSVAQSVSDSNPETVERGSVGVVVEGSEGYYELCIKSVDAVKWDPEMDDAEGEST